jgi:hypothetical protein
MRMSAKEKQPARAVFYFRVVGRLLLALAIYHAGLSGGKFDWFDPK